MYSSTPSRSICLAITRLRRGAIICCWLVGLALACQMLIWSLATYTQIRYAADAGANPEVAAEEKQPVIVKRDPVPSQQGRLLPPPPAPVAEAETPRANDDDAVVKLSDYDRQFAALFDFAGGAGRIAVIVLLAAMALGVTLGASAAISGAERTALAFIWAVVVALFVLPLGQTLLLPWEDGALSRYAHMTEWVDQVEAERVAALAGETTEEAGPSSLVFHARFLVLPLACIVGLLVVGLRFSVALEAAVMKRESMKLDPAVEREASNISPTSLHGSRGASIISRTIASPQEAEPVGASKDADDVPPKRLI